MTPPKTLFALATELQGYCLERHDELLEIRKGLQGVIDGGQPEGVEPYHMREMLDVLIDIGDSSTPRAAIAASDLEAIKKIRAAFKEMSPSAPYDLRREAILNLPTGKGWLNWWDTYPYGNVTRFVSRVARILGEPLWEIEGDELPLKEGIDGE